MFEPEELMARIVDLEEQLKVSEMAPPAAEQLIACLEGEIAKRDETIARLEADNRSKNGSLKAFGEQIAGLQKAVRNRERLVRLRDARIVELDAELCERTEEVEHALAYLNNALAELAAPAAPAADASDVLEQAMYTLISIGYHENSGLVHELRQALAAHSAKGVV